MQTHKLKNTQVQSASIQAHMYNTTWDNWTSTNKTIYALRKDKNLIIKPEAY